MKDEVIVSERAMESLRGIIRPLRYFNEADHYKIYVTMYWDIGKIIDEEVNKTAKGNEEKLINVISKKLIEEFGENYCAENLKLFRKLYLCFPDFYLISNHLKLLRWEHFKCLINIEDENERLWYFEETVKNGWDEKTLEAKINEGQFTVFIDQMEKAVKTEKALTTLTRILKSTGMSEDEIDMLLGRFLQEEAFDFVDYIKTGLEKLRKNEEDKNKFS